MEQRPHKEGDAVSIQLEDGRLEGGWKIFMIKADKGMATVVRETGADIESRDVALENLH